MLLSLRLIAASVKTVMTKDDRTDLTKITSVTLFNVNFHRLYAYLELPSELEK